MNKALLHLVSLVAMLLPIGCVSRPGFDVERMQSALVAGHCTEISGPVIAAAREGYAEAQLLLAEMYERGCGVPQDLAYAQRYYEYAARQNNSAARAKLQRLGAEVPDPVLTTANDPNALVKAIGQSIGQGVGAGVAGRLMR